MNIDFLKWLKPVQEAATNTTDKIELAHKTNGKITVDVGNGEWGGFISKRTVNNASYLTEVATGALPDGPSAALELRDASNTVLNRFDMTSSATKIRHGDFEIAGKLNAEGGVYSTLETSRWLDGNKGSALVCSHAVDSSGNGGKYVALTRYKSTDGVFCQSGYGSDFRLIYTADSTISAGTNSFTHSATLLNQDGNTTFPGTVTAKSFTTTGAFTSTGTSSMATLGITNTLNVTGSGGIKNNHNCPVFIKDNSGTNRTMVNIDTNMSLANNGLIANLYIGNIANSGTYLRGSGIYFDAGGWKYNFTNGAEIQINSNPIMTGTRYVAEYNNSEIQLGDPGTALSLFGKGANFYVTSDSTGGRIYSQDVYNREYSSAANMYVTSNGTIGRSTSASKYKLCIEEAETNYKNVLDLKIKSWFDKTNSELYAEVLTKSLNPEEEDIQPVERLYGLIAEDVAEVGLGEFCHYGKNHELEGIQYDRLWINLIPIVKELVEEVKELKQELAELKG